MTDLKAHEHDSTVAITERIRCHITHPRHICHSSRGGRSMVIHHARARVIAVVVVHRHATGVVIHRHATMVHGGAW